ncbi:MAG TPA: pyridoxamine 5'-phosphate oxidase family protein [Methanocorpusculum sp.]|nr:pyridoxamine 5'-phosphate oxidase family protein [Methanocorpusculum sp.]
MFRTLRRSAQQLSEESCVDILQRQSSGVLSVLGDDGYPYGVPLSFCYADGRIIFHCAPVGHKIDALNRCDKASFTVIDCDEIVAVEYTTYFRSVIAFGRVHVITDSVKKRELLDMLARRYYPQDTADHRTEVLESSLAHVCMLEMTIDHMCGKQARELVKPADK